MKAKIEFDLNDVDDKMAHKRCVKATDMAICLFEIKHNLIRDLSNRIESGNISEDEILVKLGELIDRILYDNNVILEDLID